MMDLLQSFWKGTALKNKIYIIGAGKVGSAFALELNDIGYQVYYLTDRNQKTLEAISSKINPVSISDKIEKEFISDSDIVIISVQDRYLGDVIKEIGNFNLDLNNKYFIHTSGSQSTDIFPGDKYNHSYLVSLHPIQTFDNVSFKNEKLLENIYFGIEGGDHGTKLAIEIIEKLNSKYVDIPKDKKYLYHSACVVVSNFLVTLLNVSSEIMGSIGIEKGKVFEIFNPILNKTLSNISEHGLVNSLTGPFERNDIETISHHLSSLKKELPSLLPFYTLLGMETVKIAFKKESMDLKNVISILDLMNEYIIKEASLTNKTIN